MQFRQGLGLTKTFYGEAPTTRADGTPLPANQIAGYIMLAQHGQDTVAETVDIQLVDGAFSEPVSVDVLSVGVWKYWFRTVDTEGRQSADSEVLTFEVTAPLAAPNPPTGLSVS